MKTERWLVGEGQLKRMMSEAQKKMKSNKTRAHRDHKEKLDDTDILDGAKKSIAESRSRLIYSQVVQQEVQSHFPELVRNAPGELAKLMNAIIRCTDVNAEKLANSFLLQREIEEKIRKDEESSRKMMEVERELKKELRKEKRRRKARIKFIASLKSESHSKAP